MKHTISVQNGSKQNHKSLFHSEVGKTEMDIKLVINYESTALYEDDFADEEFFSEATGERATKPDRLTVVQIAPATAVKMLLVRTLEGISNLREVHSKALSVVDIFCKMMRRD
jgi:hypothetical protein